MRRVYAYLLQRRFLDREVVSAFARAGLLYESCERSKDGTREYHNAVFVGRDENGVARHAHKRSVNDLGKTFRINVEGCDPKCSFHRISHYSGQLGKCAVTGRRMGMDEIHCHHKIPLKNGGTDGYQNLLIVHKDVHILIHATQPETIQAFLSRISLTQTMLKKINKYRIMAGNTAI